MTRTARWLWLLLPALAHAGCAHAPAATTAPPGPGSSPPGPGPETAAAVIDSILTTPPLDRAHWGISVVDARTGAPLLQRNAHKLFITASNMKLVTVAAALALLGPDYRFTTRVVAEGTGDAPGVARRLVVYGSGDPTFSRAFHDRAGAPLDSLADSLAAAGLRRVDGPLVVDQRRFEARTVHPAWEVFDLDWYYAAPVAPFAIAEGAIPVVVRPAAPGARADVEVLEVPGLVGLDASIATGDGDRGWNDRLRRYPDADSLSLAGTIGAGAEPDTSWIAQTDPGRLAGRALRAALAGAGVEVGGAVVVETGDPEAEADPGDPATAGAAGAPDAATEVVWRSPPLVEMIRLPLSESDNWVTEQLLKTIGAEVRGEGSWSGGTAAVEAFLTDTVGAPEGGIYMRDGSGLTAQNLVTPATFVALLRWVGAQPWGAAFRDALAKPGEPESTLERRLLDHRGRVAAKTGTIRHVNALSGFATTAGGRPLVFSLLSNGSGLPSSTVRAALDRILEQLLLQPGS